MKNKIRKFVTHTFVALMLLAFSNPNALAQGLLNEKAIVEMARKESILLHGFKAENFGNQVGTAMNMEKFTPYLFLGANSNYTNEPAFSSPAPKSTDTSVYSMGYMQNLIHGLKISAGLYSSTSKFDSFLTDEYKVTGGKLTLEIDLLKNIFGRLEKKIEASNLANSVKSNEVYKLKVNEHAQTNRSIYWSIIANSEIQKLRKQIIRSVEKQEEEIKRQNTLYVSDKADVTRFSALKEMQESSLIMLKYSREQLESSLKNFYPKLRGKNLEFDSPDLDSAADTVMQCINNIATHKTPPLDASSWVKVIKASEVSSELKMASNNLYSSPDIKLTSKVEYTDREAEISGADSLEDDPYQNRTVELSVNIPLGSTKSTSQKWQNYALKQAKLAETQNYIATIATAHEKTLRLINLLNNALKTQAQVNELNKTSLQLSREKFNRAELPLVQLINDETTYLTGKVSEIETKLLIVNTLLDYLKVFDKYDCQFNKI